MDELVAGAESPLSTDSDARPMVKLAVFQFLLYSIALGVATTGWVLAFSGNRVLLASVFGQYLADHIIRWTSEVPLWGVLCGAAGLLGVTAALALLRTRAVGVGIGTISYVLGLAVDLAVARTLFVHLAAGLLVGWMLFSPLAFGWRYFIRTEAQCCTLESRMRCRRRWCLLRSVICRLRACINTPRQRN